MSFCRCPWAAGVGLALLLSVSTVAYGSVQGPAATTEPKSKIEVRVLEEAAGGRTTSFYVVMREKADVKGAKAIKPRAKRTAFVHQALRATAERSQAGLRGLLEARGVSHKSFWLVNAIRVTGDEKLMLELAGRPEVEKIVAEPTIQKPKPMPAAAVDTTDGIEWGIHNVRAPEVWSQFGTRGEGIVVAHIDTGVDFEHPALVNQYRGNRGGGTFDHNYNWFEPRGYCPDAPCDPGVHGTHTMGTIVGDDGDTNHIGVAPGAKWISCGLLDTFENILTCGQWFVAPTDLNGQNPRPDLAPHVINNSWGTPAGGGFDFYQGVVDAWTAAGIFPGFSAGNEGPGCSTGRSPGDYPDSYTSGAHDVNNAIASFSSRGASDFGGDDKPNLTAPGVAVRSALPTWVAEFGLPIYYPLSGTSMAGPHTVGAVALLWSAVPALEGDIDGTRQVLDDSAIDVMDGQCGGTLDDNNVWGEGRLDALAAVERAADPRGRLVGRITDVTTGQPLRYARLALDGGPTSTAVTTNVNGFYHLSAAPGTYALTASRFGSMPHDVSKVEVVAGATTTRNIALVPLPTFHVSGVVRDPAGNPVPGAEISLPETHLPSVTTGADGTYFIAGIPKGTYDFRLEVARCLTSQTRKIQVKGHQKVDWNPPQLTDSFGYVCEMQPSAFIEASDVLALTGDDAFLEITLPFPFPLYGETHTKATVSTNGVLDFAAQRQPFDFINTPIPRTSLPNAAIYAYWSDLVVDAQASVRTQTLGAAPHRQFVVEWRNVTFYWDDSLRVTFEVVLHEDGRILAQFADLDPGERGDEATLGIENAAGTVALQYSFERPSLENGLAILYRRP